MFTENFIPEEWKMAIAIPIHKPNKDPCSSESYRLISLLNCMMKLLEKILCNRLKWTLEKENKFNLNQCGFRSKLSAVDAILNMEIEIKNALIKNEHTIAIFFDIKQAYDTTWKYRVIKTLLQYRIKGKMINFINNYTSNRKFKVKNGNYTSNTFNQTNGLPQGSILSVLLFLIAINDIGSEINYPVKYTIYADDFVIFCSGKNVLNTQQYLQNAINKLETWCKRTGYTFSQNKTNCILFHRKPNKIQKPTLTLNNNNIEYKSNIKYLGIIFDEKLSWVAHIKYLRQTTNSNINILKYLNNIYNGADRKSLQLIYNSIIKSKIEYASTAYTSANITALKILNPILNTCLRIISGAYRSSPINSIYAESGEIPPDLKFDLLVLKHAIKTLSNRKNLNYNIIKYPPLLSLFLSKPKFPRSFAVRAHTLLQQINLNIEDIQQEMYINKAPWYKTHLDTNTALAKYKKETKQLYPELNLSINTILHNFENHIKMYTDGSKSVLGTGCAVKINEEKYQIKLHNLSSSFSSELWAIQEATNIAKSRQKHTLILTDSLSSIQIIKNMYNQNPVKQNIINNIQQLNSKGLNTTIMWVPSHSGIVANEEVDKLAKEATKKSELDVSTISYTDAISYIKQHIISKHNSRWQKTNNNKLRLQKPHTKKYHSPYLRSEQVAITRVLIGHTKLTHQYLMSEEQPPSCALCITRLTMTHIMEECGQYINNRIKYNINRMENDKTTPSYLDDLLKFLREIKILNKL